MQQIIRGLRNWFNPAKREQQVTDMPIDQMPDSTVAWIIAALAVPLFGFLSVIANGVFKSRSEAREARDEAVKARQGISTVKANTQAFTDGFPDRMDGKLDQLIKWAERVESRLGKVETSVTKHLEWHIDERKRR